MDHAITIRDIFWLLLAIATVLGIGAGIFGLIWLFNPFRSGH